MYSVVRKWCALYGELLNIGFRKSLYFGAEHQEAFRHNDKRVEYWKKNDERNWMHMYLYKLEQERHYIWFPGINHSSQ